MAAKRKYFTIFGISVIIISITIILLSASEFVAPYRTVSEVINNSSSFTGQQIQIIGKVAPGSIQTGSGEMTFTITDGNAELHVIHSGSTPQNFQEGIDIVVIGKLISADTFQANEILTKCPSKYQ